MEKGRLIYEILETIKEINKDAWKPAPASEFRGPILRKDRRPGLRKEMRLKEREELYKKERLRRQQTTYRLLKDGLLERSNKSLSLTEKGLHKLEKLKRSFLLQSFINAGKKDMKYRKGKGELIIVTFDIPEKYRAIRNLVRNTLKSLDYKMIHQSVWCGVVPLPEDFMNNLRDLLDMDRFIRVFTIVNKGNLDLDLQRDF